MALCYHMADVIFGDVLGWCDTINSAAAEQINVDSDGR